MNFPQRPTDQDNEYVFDVEGFTAPAWLGFVLLGGAAMWGGFFLWLIIFASTGNARTIEADFGGSVIEYAMEVNRLRDARGHVSILGPCASACTMYLALDQICVGPEASFTFHAPHGAAEDMNAWARDFMLGSYPAWVRGWIDANGGLTASLITMPGDYAARFIARC